MSQSVTSTVTSHRKNSLPTIWGSKGKILGFQKNNNNTKYIANSHKNTQETFSKILLHNRYCVKEIDCTHIFFSYGRNTQGALARLSVACYARFEYIRTYTPFGRWPFVAEMGRSLLQLADNYPESNPKTFYNSFLHYVLPILAGSPTDN